MKKQTSLILHLIFLVIVLIELVGRFTDNINLEYPVKPLIMIWIAVYFLLFRKKKNFTIPVLVAFFFSWLGDNFLMLSGKDEMFFYAGVGAFFFAQLAYIYIYTRYREEKRKGYLQKNPLIIVLFLLYVGGLFYILLPGLEGMMNAIILVYALSLMGMFMMALNRRGRVNPSSFRYVFFGSLLFLASDSMIAINKFDTEIPMAGFWFMLTYIFAQYLIMRGLIQEKA